MKIFLLGALVSYSLYSMNPILHKELDSTLSALDDQTLNPEQFLAKLKTFRTTYPKKHLFHYWFTCAYREFYKGYTEANILAASSHQYKRQHIHSVTTLHPSRHLQVACTTKELIKSFDKELKKEFKKYRKEQKRAQQHAQRGAVPTAPQ